MQYKVLNYRKRFFFLISTVLSVLLLTFSIEQALPVEVKNTDPEKTRKELKSLNKKISKLQKAQNKNINRRDKTQKKLKETELEINSISKKAFKIEKQLNTSNKAISEYKLKFEQLNEQKTQQQGALIADIRSSYSSGKEEYLKLILSQKDPHTLSRHVRYYEYFQKARVKRIAGYNQTISELDEITASLEKEAELLESLRKRLNEQKSALKGAQKQRLTACQS